MYCQFSGADLSPMDAQPVVLVKIYCHNFVTNVTQVRDVTVSYIFSIIRPLQPGKIIYFGKFEAGNPFRPPSH